MGSLLIDRQDADLADSAPTQLAPQPDGPDGPPWDGNSSPWNSGQLGLWFFLATVVMLFAGFTSAIFVRHSGLDWQPIPLPHILWLNTGVLLASSLTLERAAALARRSRFDAVRSWVAGTALLGVVFVAGQMMAWQRLRAAGVYLSSNPHSSFFFLLTGAHAVHLAGGLAVLAYLALRLSGRTTDSSRISALKLCTTYWHFLSGLWVYLLLVVSAA